MKYLILFLTSLSVTLPTSIKAAESYLVMEAHSSRVLLAANSEQKRPVASLTKVATAKVALDWAKISQTSLSTMITVPAAAFTFGGANPMGLRPGDRISFRDALYSALLGSDGIAAQALADHVGRALLVRRQRAGDPIKTFVAEMNQLAKALGMRRTRFANAHGFNLPRRKGYSTAADMARLGVHVMRDTGFTFFVKQATRSVSVVNVEGKKLNYKIGNTNSLLGQLGINGIKTGLTAAAGQCLVVNAHRSPLVKKIDDSRSQIRKRDLMVVVLGSADRIGRAKQLINQSWPLYDQWAADGYPVSPKGRELIVVPSL
ncbi:MAG: serine hydrolase [Verrucomicrobiae bacterium]|nr:serine hydrolase [Verrucomicrobiae bacterium]NNJ43043.1 D-alanyl-D-alanine carboxypeptidase [Akkermansiaceae bacterium]